MRAQPAAIREERRKFSRSIKGALRVRFRDPAHSRRAASAASLRIKDRTAYGSSNSQLRLKRSFRMCKTLAHELHDERPSCPPIAGGPTYRSTSFVTERPPLVSSAGRPLRDRISSSKSVQG